MQIYFLQHPACLLFFFTVSLCFFFISLVNHLFSNLMLCQACIELSFLFCSFLSLCGVLINVKKNGLNVSLVLSYANEYPLGHALACLDHVLFWLLLISMTIGRLAMVKFLALSLIIFYNFLALHITQIVGAVGGAPRPRITPHVLVKFAFY